MLEKGCQKINQQFSYPSILYLFHRYFSLLGSFVFAGFGLAMIATGFLFPFHQTTPGIINDPGVTLLCFGIWFVLVAYFGCGILVNFYPTVWVSDRGIVISHFIFFRLVIPWEQVTFVFLKRTWFHQYTMVLAKRISPFHKIASLVFFHTMNPGFVIGDGIEHKEELLRIIRHKAHFHSQAYRDNLLGT